jgi:SAM-dependent methyltransferase
VNELELLFLDIGNWNDSQKHFLERSYNKDKYSDPIVEQAWKDYGAYFNKRGSLLSGNILDVGGGLGIFREWWEVSRNNIFIVHEPIVERKIHNSHYKYFHRAFSLPMKRIRGIGEKLPYKDNSFDTCLISNVLDHCVNPVQVLSEAYRCLTPGGTILVFQSCRKTWQLKQLFKHLFRPSGHLHHFKVADIVSMIQKIGFSQIQTSNKPIRNNVYPFEGIKKQQI